MATELSSRGWMDPVPDLSTFKIVEVPRIEFVTSWLVVSHANP